MVKVGLIRKEDVRLEDEGGVDTTPEKDIADTVDAEVEAGVLEETEEKKDLRKMTKARGGSSSSPDAVVVELGAGKGGLGYSIFQAHHAHAKPALVLVERGQNKFKKDRLIRQNDQEEYVLMLI